MDERSIAARLGEVAAALRSPLARTLAGDVSDAGQTYVAELDALLLDLPTVPATTPADALALTILTQEMVDILAANATGNDTAISAAGVVGNALRLLTACLADMAGRPDADFRILGGWSPNPVSRLQ